MKSRLLLTTAVCAFAILAAPAIAAEATGNAAAGATGAVGATTDTSNGSIKATGTADLTGTAKANGTGNAAGSNAAAGADANAMASTNTSITIDTIDTSAPFGEIKVDPALTIEQLDAGLTAEARAELQDRCQVVVQNEAKFDPSFPVWCKDYLSFRAKATASN